MLLRLSALLAATAAVRARPRCGREESADLVTHQFRESAAPTRGSVKTLQDLRGTPVLIEFWGTH